MQRWKSALDSFFEEHEEILLDADARSTAFFMLDDAGEKTDHAWHVRQIFNDSEGDRDFGIDAQVDLDATQEAGEAVFADYRVGFVEDLLDL